MSVINQLSYKHAVTDHCEVSYTWSVQEETERTMSPGHCGQYMSLPVESF